MRKANKFLALEQKIPELDQVGASILKVEASLPLAKNAGEQVLAMQERLNDISRTTAIINEVVTQITDIETQIKQAIDNVNEANQSDTNSEHLTSLYNELMNIHGIIQNTRTDLQQKVDQVTSGINTAADFVKDGLPTVEQKIHKAADFVRNDLPKVEQIFAKPQILFEISFQQQNKQSIRQPILPEMICPDLKKK